MLFQVFCCIIVISIETRNKTGIVWLLEVTYRQYQKLLPLLEKHDVTFVWVKGHAGHPENEHCDRLAVQQRDKYSL